MKKATMLLTIIISMLITSCSGVKTEIDKDTLSPELNSDLQTENILDTNAVDTPLITNATSFGIITVGTGTPEYSPTKANASTIITINEKYYIIDCGDGVYANMLEMGLDFRKIGGIFFTHHHIDHTSDFFNIYTNCIQTNNKITVVGPPRTEEFTDFTADVYLDDILYRKSDNVKNTENLKDTILSNLADVIELTGTNEFTLDGIKVATAEMTHTMYDLAYKFTVGNNSIVVSGDTSYDEDLVDFSKNADILVIDGALYKDDVNKTQEAGPSIEPFYKYGANTSVAPHLTFEDMVTIAHKANVKTLVITHFPEANETRINNSIIEINKTFSGEVIYAEDMMEMYVDTSVTLPVADNLSYNIVDTNQNDFYSNSAIIEEPEPGDFFYGQDANYNGNQPSYTNNNDGTITDNITNLMWSEDVFGKMSYEDAFEYANNSTLAGYDDWRFPTIKELYSLIQFDGRVLGEKATDSLFIDTDYFIQPIGNTSEGEREIDAQVWSSTKYVGTTMNSDATVFGVNFIDGRIKGYPQYNKRNKQDNEMYVRLVRGNDAYGINRFTDNNDGTITDSATGLTWQQSDSGMGMDWEDALNYAENLELDDHDDWRLPNAKELQSLVDYTKSIQTTNSPAIDDLFYCTPLEDIDGNLNYAYYWTGTTHLDGPNPYTGAVYVAFGEAFGEMNGVLMDVHGAGAQRSDPKTGDESDYPIAVGPQGDIRIVFNFVRAVRSD